MNLSNLQTFIAIVETGNLNRAAERLNVTQSTINARLNNLESEVGQALFHRRKSGAELTAAGFRFERYAQLISDIWRQARQETALPAEITSVCNFGCHEDLWSGAGQQLVRQLRAIDNAMALSAWQGEQSQLDRWMANGLIDIALCHSPSLNDSWRAIQFPSDKLIQVATVDRRVMRWDSEYIYVDHGETFRRDHAVAYPDGDTPTVTFGTPVWALDFLKEFGGSAYLPERLVLNELASGELFKVRGAAVFDRPVYLLVNHRKRDQWPWFEALVDQMIGQRVRQV